ncbi:MAG: sulfate ABC transporter permease subunit CysW, partial [Burkholderiaceae bacterium]
SVVSGHIRGVTNTIPLQVEILYNEYQFQAAFAVASLLALLAIATLVVKTFIEWRVAQAARQSSGPVERPLSLPPSRTGAPRAPAPPGEPAAVAAR